MKILLLYFRIAYLEAIGVARVAAEGLHALWAHEQDATIGSAQPLIEIASQFTARGI
jgi:hypothetical protein